MVYWGLPTYPRMRWGKLIKWIFIAFLCALGKINCVVHAFCQGFSNVDNVTYIVFQYRFKVPPIHSMRILLYFSLIFCALYILWL